MIKKDLWSHIIKNVTYPLWMMRDGKAGVLKYLWKYETLNDLPRDVLLKRQFDNLKQILIYAYETTKYYKDVFDQYSFSPYDMTGVGSIKNLPLLSKKDIRENVGRLLSSNVKESERHHDRTGGSTGLPIEFFRDDECFYKRRGQELFFDRWMGYDIGTKVAYFVSGSHYDGPLGRLKAKIRNFTCERELRFDPNDIQEKHLDSFLGEFKKFNPSIIKCFPNALSPFADYLLKKGEQTAPVHSISCTGENLYEAQKEAYAKAFQGEVFEKYGTRECGVIACECKEHNGMHIFTEGVFLEVITDSGENAREDEIGRIVVTDLFNRAMPFIRYDIGDMSYGLRERLCSCGSQLPMVEKIIGRDRDILSDSEGNQKPGYLFVEEINKMSLDAQFQIVQTQKTEVIIKIVKNETEDYLLDKLIVKFKDILGEEMDVKVSYVDSIERDPSGKYRYISSLIK